MNISKVSQLDIHLTDQEIGLFLNVLDKCIKTNKEIGFKKNKLSAEESEFVTYLCESIKK